MLHSFYYPIARVEFPEYLGRQHYMHEFDPMHPTMPRGFEDYIPMACKLADAMGVIDPIFITIDEKIVQSGQSQRRPGPHVDGCFIPTKPEAKAKAEAESLTVKLDDNFTGYWGHQPYGSGWNHYCNAVPMKRMPVIVASSVAGCRVWEGSFDAEPQNDGDLSHIWDDLGKGVVLPANTAYLLSPDCVHESMVFNEPTQRQFIRLALPVNTPI